MADQKKSGGTHAIMSSSLAKALIEQGVQHFDMGGDISTMYNYGLGSGMTGALGGAAYQGLFGGNGILGAGTSGLFGNTGIMGAMGGMGQNNFQSRDPGGEEAAIQSSRMRQGQVYGAQQALANQLMKQTMGVGPNPAQDQLAQTTGQNMQQQGALMASQRGSNANAGLVARQAAQQGGNIQQQAAGQAATLRAQQILGAQQAAGQQQSNMGNLALNQQGLEQGMLGNINNTQAQVAAGNAKNQAGLMGGLMQGAGMLGAAAIMANKGGQIPKLAGGGGIEFPMKGLAYNLPQFHDAALDESQTATSGGTDSLAKALGSQLGKSDALGEGGGDTAMLNGAGPMMMMDVGGGVPGQAKVSGDSETNDVVPALLSPGEVVLPRSVVQGPNQEAKVLEFLAHLKSQRTGGYADVIGARKMNKGGKAK